VLKTAHALVAKNLEVVMTPTSSSSGLVRAGNGCEGVGVTSAAKLCKNLGSLFRM
jgi:hypothetical protein